MGWENKQSRFSFQANRHISWVPLEDTEARHILTHGTLNGMQGVGWYAMVLGLARGWYTTNTNTKKITHAMMAVQDGALSCGFSGLGRAFLSVA